MKFSVGLFAVVIIGVCYAVLWRGGGDREGAGISKHETTGGVVARQGVGEIASPVPLVRQHGVPDPSIAKPATIEKVEVQPVAVKGALTTEELLEYHAAFETIYENRTKEELILDYQDIYAQVPVEIVQKLHQEKVDNGDFRVFGETKEEPNGMRSIVVSSDMAKTQRPFLDSIHRHKDGRAVTTQLDYHELGEHMERAIEAAWLVEKVRRMR